MESPFGQLGAAREFYNVIDADARLGVLFAGHERTAPRHRAQTVRDHYLFHYVLEGRGTVTLGRRTWSLGPGGGFLLAPGVAGSYASDARDPWAYAWVGFHGRDAVRLLPQVGFAGRAVIESTLDDTLTQRLLGLAGILEGRQPGFSLAAEGQLLLVLADLARLAGPLARVDLDAKALGLSWAEAAAEFIQTNHHRPIGVADVAAYVGFHPSHLGRLFRGHYGTSVQAWLVRTRIERAKLLLRSTRTPIAEVARSVGYRDYGPFEKRFRGLTGLSATAYRRGHFFT